jgi:hypothetical protein
MISTRRSSMELAKEMRALLGRREESGLSLLAFAKREKLSYAKLLYWDRKFRGLEVKRRKSAPKVDLMPVRVVPDAVSAEEPRAFLGVWLANGVSLEIPPGFDPVELERLVSVLSTC